MSRSKERETWNWRRGKTLYLYNWGFFCKKSSQPGLLPWRFVPTLPQQGSFSVSWAVSWVSFEKSTIYWQSPLRCVRDWIHLCICMYIYIRIYVCTCIYVCIHIYVYMYIIIYIGIHVCTCTYIYVHIYIYIYICMCVYKCTYIYIYIYVYINRCEYKETRDTCQIHT